MLENTARRGFSVPMRYRFAQCDFDVARHSLIRAGVRQNTEPQVFDLLALLVAQAGTLVTWDRIVQEVWQGRAISDSTISARVAAVRRAVGDDGTRQAIIRTVPRRGLMLVAEVAVLDGDESETLPEVRSSHTQVVRFTRADDGLNLAYALSGEGPPLLRVMHSPSHLEHDWTDPVDKPLNDALGRIRQLVRYDKRGTGLSETEIDSLDAETEIEDLRAVADAAELSRFDLMGSSGSGVMTAVGFAARYPGRVRRLVLQSGCAEGRTVRRGPEGASPETFESMIREGWSAPGSPFIAAYLTTYFPGASQAWIAKTANWMQKSSPARSAQLFRQTMNAHSVVDLLGQVQAPTLVIQSSGDAVHPVAEARRLAAGIPGAQLRVINSINHYVLPDEPVWPEFVEALCGFLTEPDA
jgi:pimeloyl-ACP methyl ester carboxylesterase/DNA-binding winged helix-turn-helix (wHTH) protein